MVISGNIFSFCFDKILKGFDVFVVFWFELDINLFIKDVVSFIFIYVLFLYIVWIVNNNCLLGVFFNM